MPLYQLNQPIFQRRALSETLASCLKRLSHFLPILYKAPPGCAHVLSTR